MFLFGVLCFFDGCVVSIVVGPCRSLSSVVVGRFQSLAVAVIFVVGNRASPVDSRSAVFLMIVVCSRLLAYVRVCTCMSVYARVWPPRMLEMVAMLLLVARKIRMSVMVMVCRMVELFRPGPFMLSFLSIYQRGTWCSGIAPASHAGVHEFNPQSAQGILVCEVATYAKHWVSPSCSVGFGPCCIGGEGGGGSMFIHHIFDFGFEAAALSREQRFCDDLEKIRTLVGRAQWIEPSCPVGFGLCCICGKWNYWSSLRFRFRSRRAWSPAVFFLRRQRGESSPCGQSRLHFESITLSIL